MLFRSDGETRWAEYAKANGGDHPILRFSRQWADMIEEAIRVEIGDGVVLVKASVLAEVNAARAIEVLRVIGEVARSCEKRAHGNLSPADALSYEQFVLARRVLRETWVYGEDLNTWASRAEA